MFNVMNIWAEDEGLARSAQSVGTLVLVKVSEDSKCDKQRGMYALVIMVMLMEASESSRTLIGAPEWATYRKHDSIDGRDVFDFTRRI